MIANCTQDYTSTQDPNLANNEACVNTSVTLVNPPDSLVTVSKDGPAVVRPGGTMTYTIDVTNHGPDAANGVIVTDPVDTTVMTVISLPANCALRGSSVVCAIGRLAVGQTETVTFTAVVEADAAPGSEITNCAAAGSDSTVLTREPATECTQAYVLPQRRALVTVTKTAPAQVLPNGIIRYTVTVTNHGPNGAANVVVVDPMNNADLVTTTSLPGGCTAADGMVTCDLGTLRPGETRVLTAEVRVNADLTDGTVIKNCAAAYTTTSSTDLADAQSCVNTVVIRPTTPFLPVTG